MRIGPKITIDHWEKGNGVHTHAHTHTEEKREFSDLDLDMKVATLLGRETFPPITTKRLNQRIQNGIRKVKLTRLALMEQSSPASNAAEEQKDPSDLR